MLITFLSFLSQRHLPDPVEGGLPVRPDLAGGRERLHPQVRGRGAQDPARGVAGARPALPEEGKVLPLRREILPAVEGTGAHPGKLEFKIKLLE